MPLFPLPTLATPQPSEVDFPLTSVLLPVAVKMISKRDGSVTVLSVWSQAALVFSKDDIRTSTHAVYPDWLTVVVWHRAGKIWNPAVELRVAKELTSFVSTEICRILYEWSLLDSFWFEICIDCRNIFYLCGCKSQHISSVLPFRKTEACRCLDVAKMTLPLLISVFIFKAKHCVFVFLVFFLLLFYCCCKDKAVLADSLRLTFMCGYFVKGK